MSQPPEQDHDDRPSIKIEEGELPRLIDQSTAALTHLNKIYIYGERPCIIHTAPHEETGTISRPAGATRVHYPDGVHLTELLTSAAKYYRFDRRLINEDSGKKDGGYRLVNAPRRIADHILARGAFHEFPRLDGIIEAPTVWHGEKIDRPGYHVASRLYLTQLPAGYRSPASDPTLKDALRAVNRMLDTISTFSFATEADRAAAIAAMMSPVLRRTLPSAPALCFDAPASGSGKSLLARVVSEIAIGRQGSLLALTGDEAEDEKRLAAGLLAADSILSADNLEAAPGGSLINSMLTEPSVSVRVLGQSLLVPVPTNVSLLINGNNLQIVRDMRRRVLLVRLNAGCERPEERVFTRDAVQYVRERRGSLIRDILTIVLAYQNANEPPVGTHPFGGFEQWDRTVRRPLVWCGLDDPLLPVDGLREMDPDLEATRSLFSSWREAFGDRGATCAEAIAAARKYTSRFDGDTESDHPELRESLQMAATDKLDSRRLAAWLRRHRDKIVDGLTLRQGADGHAKVARWTVIECGVRRS